MAVDAPVAFAGVRLGYAGRPVLDGVTFALRPGEFVGLLGPNGAGKTTLLRAMLGLVQPGAGQVRVFGRPARRGNPAIGYMPQGVVRGGAGRLCGWEHVAAALGGRWGAPWLGRAARLEVGRVLELVDATALARRPLEELSGGERQRLLLAQALLGSPRLLLLDEPLISLDPRHQHGVVALVRRVQRELGLAVVFSAHELNPLLPAMDRVLYVGAGQVALGAVDQVVTGPVLSRLYQAPVQVVRAGGRVFVLVEGAGDAHRAARTG